MYLSRVKRRILAAMGSSALALTAAVVGPTGVASANATTCLQESLDTLLCMQVNGSGGYVASVKGVYTIVLKPYDAICNYSAWFYEVPPQGGAYGVGYTSRAGCTYGGTADLTANIGKTYPRNTLMCVKWYINHSQVIGTKCVGLS